MKNIAILGSTGHVGKCTLAVAAAFKEELNVHALCCNKNTALLKVQAKKFSPKYVSIADDGKRYELAKEFSNIATIEEIVTDPDVDAVVFAMDGSDAVLPAFLAAASGKDIILANKEILAVAGEAFMSLCREKKVRVFPVDNEHSAIDQCLRGENTDEVERLILTASGGPFYKITDRDDFTYEEASVHPTYKCGKKVAVNCSIMMNKGLEIIEAKHLFGIDASKIDVVIHPQSIVQSLIEYNDGVIKAIFGNPDITHPLQYALLNKKRKKGPAARFCLEKMRSFEFYPKDLDRFKCLKLAFDAVKVGGAKSSYLNAASEVLVERFCLGEVSWRGIGENLEELMNKKVISSDASLESVLETDRKARIDAWEISKR